MWQNWRLYYFWGLICVSCKKETSGAHTCKRCQKPCHAITTCALNDENTEEEGFGSKVLCLTCATATTGKTGIEFN